MLEIVALSSYRYAMWNINKGLYQYLGKMVELFSFITKHAEDIQCLQRLSTLARMKMLFPFVPFL